MPSFQLTPRHSSCGRRWLPLHLRQVCVDAGPARRRRRPDRHRRIGKIRMVEGADAHKDQMGPRFCLTEERRPASRAESPVHLVATVRDTRIIVTLACHDECRCPEAGVHRPAPGTEILALPAPANARDNRRRRAFPANFPTEASTCDRHSVLQSTTAKPSIADATSWGTIPANRAVSPRLRVHGAIEGPLTGTCLCARSWPRAAFARSRPEAAGDGAPNRSWKLAEAAVQFIRGSLRIGRAAIDFGRPRPIPLAPAYGV